jgi:hypothetical protein
MGSGRRANAGGVLGVIDRKNVHAMAGFATFQTWKEHISAFELEEKCKAT